MRHLDLTLAPSHCMHAAHPDSDVVHVSVAAKNCNTTRYTMPKDEIRKTERYIIHFETGISPQRIHFLEQFHGDTIVEISALSDTAPQPGDAMISCEPGTCLVIRTADCIPVMLYDLTQKCIAAVHSGWRSTRKNITGKVVCRMINSHGCTPGAIRALILPGISMDSYEVSEDVALQFPGHYIQTANTYYLSLQSAIRAALRAEGVAEENIHASFYDTFAHNTLFFSHRKGDEGRNLNFIYT